MVLQDLRHNADYNPAWETDRTRVREIIGEARESIELFDAARGGAARRFDLAAAPLWETLRKRKAA